MDPEARRSGQATNMIADDFVELGSNGRLYNKSEALAIMRPHALRIFVLEEFSLRELAPHVVRVTCHVQSHAIEGGQRPPFTPQFVLGAAGRQMASDLSSGHDAELTF